MVENLLYTSTMTLSIHEQDVCELAQDLAERASRDLEAVVYDALVEYKKHLDSEEHKRAFREALSALTGCLAGENFSMKEADDFLYDPVTGLPH